MRQVLQSLKTGETIVANVPAPAVRANHLLIRTRMTLVSAGTERMLLAFGKANLLDKARQQPDKVRAAIEKVKTDGPASTIAAIRRKLDEPLAMGYCNVGTVVEVGAGARGFAVGDRVVSNGKHAEITCVPHNLCAKVPDSVSDETAAFTIIGAIALQSLRLANPSLGESFAVIGLGLVGLLAVALLRANGCRVFAVDFNPARVELARSFGAEAKVLASDAGPVADAISFSRGRGVDGVIIAASTPSDEPIHQAAAMCRQRGRIVLVGVTGLELSRSDFYEKELSFQVSCSYGPGRYDPAYEEGGGDYPFGFVRWTAQRNFEAVLDLLDSGRLDVGKFVTHRFPFDEAERAYDVLGGSEPSLGIVLDAQCDGATSFERTIDLEPRVDERQRHPSKATLGFIGSGQYASGILIPAFQTAGARLRTVASETGVSGASSGRKFGFELATTDVETIFADPSIDAVVIATRHDSHARFVCAGLRAGKSVFVEKPVALTRQELRQIEIAYRESCEKGSPILMVGFNRRFAPHVIAARKLLARTSEPKSFVMTVNAGTIPSMHWTQDSAVGGGRILGEACHFIDLLRFLAAAPIVSTQTTRLATAERLVSDDKVTIELNFANGSIGTIHYFANGHRSFPKERLEIFTGGRVIALANFRELRAYGWPKFHTLRTWKQDKGQRACAKAFVQALRDGTSSPIPFDEIIDVANATFDAVEGARFVR